MYDIQYNQIEVRQLDQTLIQNMVVELRRGTQILGVLNLLRTNQYGYSLLQALEKKGVNMEAGTLYPLLRRLESQGLLISEWDTSESRPRKYYVLSKDGMEALTLIKAEWDSIVSQMKQLLDEE